MHMHQNAAQRFWPGDKFRLRYLLPLPTWWMLLIWGPSVLSPEKAMATHSSTLAWQIPWTEEPGRLQSMGLLGVGQNWATSLSLFTFMHWRRKWQPTPVFLPGESWGRWCLVGCRLWGHTELDMTKTTKQQQQFYLPPVYGQPGCSSPVVQVKLGTSHWVTCVCVPYVFSKYIDLFGLPLWNLSFIWII